jgi:hypothetical protein
MVAFAKTPLTAWNHDNRQRASEVALFYDSIDRVLEESQSFGGNTRNVTNMAFQSYPVTQFQFPDIGSTAGRIITNAYDLLYRRTNINEDDGDTSIAAWNFFGPSRVADLTLGNGLICTWMNNARTNSAVQAPTIANPSGVPNPAWDNSANDRLGYDGAGRPITKRYITSYTAGEPVPLVGFTTSYDRAGNKFYERALHAENRSSLYEPFDSNQIPQGGYDSIDRLLQYQRGTLAATGGDGGEAQLSAFQPTGFSGRVHAAHSRQGRAPDPLLRLVLEQVARAAQEGGGRVSASGGKSRPEPTTGHRSQTTVPDLGHAH